ncbi:MAG: type II secretion system protein GspN [Deltaproteobacteria bacterium]|nr:type II secretion system protein GspN [Deltaproteobacteria bacterium]
MRTKIIKAVCYPLFFLVCLVFFVIQGFPVKVVGELVAKQAKQKLGMKVTINDIDTLFPNGVEATGIRLFKEAKPGKEDALPTSIKIDQLSARISLFGLIGGNKDISFSSDVLSGKLEGDFKLEPEKWSLQAKLAGVNLGRLNFWPELIGQDLSGKASGSLNLNVIPKDIKAATGDIVLDLVQGQLGKGKAYGVEIPPISLGKTQINLSILKGKAEIKTFKVASDDIEASLDGYFLLQQKIEHLSAHCRLRFKPSEEKLAEIRNQIPQEFRGLFDGELNKAKGRDGYYRYSIFGRLFGGKPQFRPLKQ